jgi:hypothetical protein
MHKAKPVEIRRNLEHFTIGVIKTSENLLVLAGFVSFESSFLFLYLFDAVGLSSPVFYLLDCVADKKSLKKKAESFINELARKAIMLHFGICDSKPIDAFNHEVGYVIVMRMSSLKTRGVASVRRSLKGGVASVDSSLTKVKIVGNACVGHVLYPRFADVKTFNQPPQSSSQNTKL